MCVEWVIVLSYSNRTRVRVSFCGRISARCTSLWSRLWSSALWITGNYCHSIHHAHKHQTINLAHHSFDVLVIRLGIQLRINLQLQQDKLTWSQDGKKIVIKWKETGATQVVEMFTMVRVQLLPYRRDIRPDVQGRNHFNAVVVATELAR